MEYESMEGELTMGTSIANITIEGTVLQLSALSTSSFLIRLGFGYMQHVHQM